MSLRQNIPEMIAEKLPQKGKRGRIDDTGLRKRPQMEQIVSYLEGGQESVAFPDRLAKQIRNHPFMTQLDFFDMQEDQERKWEEEKRQHEAVTIAEQFDMSAAEVRAMGTQTNAPTGRTRVTGKQDGSASGYGTNTYGGSSSSSSAAAAAPAQHPVLTMHRDKYYTGSSSQMLGGESARGVQPQGAVPVSGVRQPSSYDHARGANPPGGPHRRPPPGSGVHPIPIRTAVQIAQQDEGINTSIMHMDEDARKRVNQARETENTKRQATQQMAAVMLSSPFNDRAQMTVDGGGKKLVARHTQAPLMDTDAQQATKRRPETEPENDRVKRQVENHVGEPVQQIPYLPVTAADVMDARAQVIQNSAKTAEAQVAQAQAAVAAQAVEAQPLAAATAAATGASDFAQLAAVVGEPATPTVISIATPRGRMPVRDRRQGHAEKQTTP